MSERLRDEVVNIKELAEKVADHAKRLAGLETKAQETKNVQAAADAALLARAQANAPKETK